MNLACLLGIIASAAVLAFASLGGAGAGSLGSWLGARAYAHFGWLGVGAVLALLAAIALARHLASSPATGHPRATVATQNT
ncbi:hypothetical protein [Micromonospora zamorensis]|uniref:hypothetical protein n=1 Tax=Micromonospora zamorensis TaxID=709883 RepID=UPI003CEA781D